MHRSYAYREMKELRDQQVRFAPRDKRLEQATRAEEFLAEIDDAIDYAWSFLTQRLIDYRSEMNPTSRLRGRELRGDLLRFIEDLTESARLRPDECSERVWMLDELAAEIGVTPKTLSRWRGRDLVGVVFCVDGKRRVGFLDSAVTRWRAAHTQRLDRSRLFSRTTRDERELLLRAARRLAQSGAAPTDVAAFLARIFGRSRETIRTLLQDFDTAHPHCAIFPNRRRLVPREYRDLATARQCGATIDTLAERFRLSRTSVYRFLAISELETIAALPLRYQGVTPEELSPEELNIKLGDLSKPEIQAIFSVVPDFREVESDALLTPDEEHLFFRQMNRCKCRAAVLRSRLDPKNPRPATLALIRRLYDESVAIKKRIAAANVRLVYHTARRHSTSMTRDLDTLISDGQLVLLETIETFNPARGNKFSSYGTWALMRAFARPPQRRPLPMETRDVETLASDVGRGTTPDESTILATAISIDQLLEHLTPRERTILTHRFGIGVNDVPRLTLHELAEMLHVSSERVRQLAAQSITRLRALAHDEFPDV